MSNEDNYDLIENNVLTIKTVQISPFRILMTALKGADGSVYAIAQGNLVVGGLGVEGNIHAGGDLVAFSSSDINLKKDISPIQNALDMINSISGNTFTWNVGMTDLAPYENGTKDTGILAQEVEALGLPGVTKTRGDGVKAVRYDRLIPVLIEAVKELTAKVKSLESNK